MFHDTMLVAFAEEIQCEVRQGPFTQAVEDAGEAANQFEQWEWLRRRLYRPARPGTTITQMYQAYEEATGTLLGCD